MFYKQGLLFMQQIFLFNKIFLSGLLKLGFLSRAGPIEAKQTTFKKKKSLKVSIFSVLLPVLLIMRIIIYLIICSINPLKKGKKFSAARI